MCGIIITLGENTLELTKEKLNIIKHRGPDSTDYYQDKHVSMGFCRLSINDHSNLGTQPYECKNLVSVTNGEIYNHQGLRDKFNLNICSQSDTHVIPELFLKLGVKCLNELDGFYSSIIFDKATKNIFSLRDPFGKKGLFLVRSSGVVFISSELKCFDVIDEFKIIPCGLHQINIKQFKLVVIAQHTLPVVTRSAQPKCAQLFSLLEQATLKRIPPKGKFGVFLSGGLDSSCISYLVNQSAQHLDATYYILGNIGSDHDNAQTVVRYLGLKDIKVVPIPNEREIYELIKKIVYITESYNPSIISNGICTYLLSKAVRADGLKVVLSGEGADELLLGYYDALKPHEVVRKRQQLINDLHVTELRRVDLASMHHSVEVRAPFLDKFVHGFAIELGHDDLFRGEKNKAILRNAFENHLPKKIINRKKESFDVGTGMRGLVISALTNQQQNASLSEKQLLTKIWMDHFPLFKNNDYFHDYPAFNHAIEKRGAIHRS